MRALRYALEEALASLWRGRQSGLLSTATIALALFVLGAFLLVTLNLERLAAEWSESAEMSVYLADGISPGDRAAIESRLASGPDRGPARIRLEERRAGALPQPRSATWRRRSVISTATRFPRRTTSACGRRPRPGRGWARWPTNCGSMPGVADVRYDQEWLTRLLGAVSLLRTAGLVLGTILTLAAALTVANVVRLALYARRDELDIMQLVGAPEAYVRGPFIVEGVLQGGVGALVALAALGAALLGGAGALSGAARHGRQPVGRAVPACGALRAAGGRGDGGRMPGRRWSPPGETSTVLDTLFSTALHSK